MHDGLGVSIHVCARAPLCMHVDINLSVYLSACILNEKGFSREITVDFLEFFLSYFPESLSACCRQGIGQAAASGVRAQRKEGKAPIQGSHHQGARLGRGPKSTWRLDRGLCIPRSTGLI